MALNCKHQIQPHNSSEKTVYWISRTGTTQIYLPAGGVATSVAEPLLACVTIHHTGRVMDATVASGGQ